MEKNLSERIAARVVGKRAPGGHSHGDENQNRAIFLGLRHDIKQALEDGWSVKSVWETLREEGKVTFGYDAFLRYTKHLILQPPSGAPAQLHEGQSDVAMTVEPEPGEPKTKAAVPQIGGFTFNPSPKKEDLY